MGISAFSGSSFSLSSMATRTTNSIFSSLGCPTLSTLGLSFSNIIRLCKSNKDDINVELKDVSLQTSTYNRIIPEVFGKVRIAGNIIWSSEITKTSIYHPQKTTKNGTQSAYTENLIRCSFAVAICKGKVDAINNIYVNDEPLNLSTYNIKIYYGDEKQKEDPTTQSYLGVNIPAFKGICYAVFTEFPLEEFGGYIPNLTFDVIRNNDISDENNMENLVKSITLIPGSGEFVYDTKTQKKYNGNWLDGIFYETSKTDILNNHTATEYTDAVDSLNDLQNTFPNIEYISLVVCWFCDNLDCGIASVYPACENNSSNTSPDTWSVAGKTRLNARVIGLDNEGNIRYGGTPSDDGVVRYVKEIKKRGIKICLYPMLMCDIDQKPWRGHIYGNTKEDIHNFFIKEDGYNNFIKHYVNLLKDDIDSVIIGSEMKKLTNFYDEINNTYPAVDEFCNLANEIRQIVKNGTIITYASDWSEYHHNDRGDYNLDKLWACSNIDVIGIDAYFPLSNEKSSIYDIQKIQDGWRSGEGYDFYYSNEERTEKNTLSPEWAWKNIEWFWNNYHYNSNGEKTNWIPKMKKVWFTEYGFPSVDCCSNQPNVFYSKGSYDSAFPRLSQGIADYKAQRVAIAGTELAWLNSECVERKFLYTWDARPYPYFPNLKNVWADADCWKYGHFLNGKVGIATLSNVVSYLCKKVGLEDDEFNTSLINNEIMSGYILNDKNTILNHLKLLAITYNFDAFIDEGVICFKSLKDTKNYLISEDDIILNNDKKIIEFENESMSSTDIPSSVELLFLDENKNYTTSTAIAKNCGDNEKNNNSYSVSLPIPMNISQAQEISWKILSGISNQNKIYSFKLPITYLSIQPLDTITININNLQHIMRVKNISILNETEIHIIGESIIKNENILSQLDYSGYTQENIKKTETTSHIPETNFELFELYNIKNDVNTNTFALHCAIWSDDKNWEGAGIYYSVDNEQNYQVLNYVNRETTIGKLVSINTINSSISPNYIDKQSEIVVSLSNEDEKMQSINEEQFLQLENKILIGNEIISFRDVEQIDSTMFKISYLLRGRFNTEDFISKHQKGEKVILLDNDFYTIDIPITQKGKTIFIKVVSNKDSLLNVEAKKIKTKALSLTDYNTKNYDIKTMLNGDLKLSFSPRKYYKIADNNIMLSNILNINIFDKKTNKKIRTIRENNSNYTFYTTSMQKNDFSKTITEKDIYFTIQPIILCGNY